MADDAAELFYDTIGTQSEQRALASRYDNFYRGVFDKPYLPTGSRALEQEYRDLSERAELPICSLVVTAVADRLRVDGIKRDTEQAEPDLTWWSWWQQSALDARQALVYRDAMVSGDGWVLVTPNGDSPRFTVEAPSNLWVVTRADDPLLVDYAAKLLDRVGWLYTDEFIFRLERRDNIAKNGGWVLAGEPVEHGMGGTPLVRFPNRLDSTGRSQSELAEVAPIQSRINQTLFDRLLVQKFASWRIAYASGIDMEFDKDGNAIPPFNPTIDSLITSPNPDARFGSIETSSFEPHGLAVENDVRHAAAVTQTPPHLLAPGTISNVSAEALVALEAGLASKVRAKQLEWGESWERSMRLGGASVGQDVPAGIEVLWANLEARSQAQVVDGVLKLRNIGLPMRYLLERLALTPSQIGQVMAEIEAESRVAAEAQARSYGVGGYDAPVEDSGGPQAVA